MVQRTADARRRGARGPAVWLGLLAACVGVAPGCATYSDRMQKARAATTAGDYAEAIEQLDKAIGVDEPDRIPDKFKSETALTILERATLKQASETYPSSARDFSAADKGLELLDIANDTAGDIGKYVFSDSATKYRSSPTEKLALNGFNMLNYLAVGDLSGARVESRRFSVMQKYLSDFDPKSAHVAFGSYVAGFTLEGLGEYGAAMRYYDEALQERSFESLRGPVERLSKLTDYRGKRIAEFLAASPPAPAVADDDPELLVVVSVGRVPHKVPERMPIGMAVGIAGSYISGNPEVLGYSAMKFIIYPKLVPSESVIGSAGLQIDGRSAELELASNLGLEIGREYEELKPRIIGAALSRMIVRAAAAEGMRQAGKQQGDGLGWALALLTEASLAAMDKPDTRSWIFLPDRVYVHRARVKPGKHDLTINLGSAGSRTATVDLPKGSFATIVVTAPQ